MKQFSLFLFVIILTGCISSSGIVSKYNPADNSVIIENTVVKISNNLKHVTSNIGSSKTENIDDEIGSDIEVSYHIFAEKAEEINSGVCVVIQRLKDSRHYIRTAVNYDHIKDFLKKGEIKIDNKVCYYFIGETEYLLNGIFKKIDAHESKFANKECAHVVWLRKQLGMSVWIDVIYSEGANNCTFYHGEAPSGYKADEIKSVWNNFNKTVRISHQ